MILNREDPAVMACCHRPAAEGGCGPGANCSNAVASGGRPAFAAARQGQTAKAAVRAHHLWWRHAPASGRLLGIEAVSGMPRLVRAMDADETRKRGRNEVEEDLHPAVHASGMRCASGAPQRHQRLGGAGAGHSSGLPAGAHALRPARIPGRARTAWNPWPSSSTAWNILTTARHQRRRHGGSAGGAGHGAASGGHSGRGRQGQDFAPLAAPVARYARAVVLIGRDAPLIRAALQDAGVPLLDAGTLPEAVALAAQRAHSGDAVLMSPACARLIVQGTTSTAPTSLRDRAGDGRRCGPVGEGMQ